MHVLIKKCASSVPGADFADFADLVHTQPIMDSWGGQWTGAVLHDGPLARAYVEEHAASGLLSVLVAFFSAERAASPAPAGH